MSTAQRLISAADHAAARQARFNSRNRVNKIALFLSLAAMGFGLFWLVWILWETLRLGLGGLNLALFTQMTPPPNEDGGISNAIFGSMVMVSCLPAFLGSRSRMSTLQASRFTPLIRMASEPHTP